MRTDPAVAPEGMSLKDLRQKFPPGASKTIFVVAEDGRYGRRTR